MSNPPWIGRAAPLMGGVLGGAFFFWIAGPRVINPTEIGWVMQFDWQFHFLGWHFFRSEPWHVPPGMIERYFAPLGTTIGFTDSIPLAAFLFKPIASMLPMPFQYLGLWLWLCFILQGVFGVLLMRVWTARVDLQLAGSTLFVMMPTLLARVGHAALASHWLLLWALWLYLKDGKAPASWRMHAGWGLAAGLIHPYLAAMGLLIIGARALRRMLERAQPFGTIAARAAAHVLVAASATLAGWWAAGVLAVSGSEDLASTGLDLYSMNLLGPVAPAGWATLLPELPLANQVQSFEGFQYLGAGILALAVVALGLCIRGGVLSWRAATPLALVCLACTVYALSPRVTLGSRVVLDYLTPSLQRLGMFRATGRFFWPMAYTLLTVSLGVVVTRCRSRVAIGIVVGAIILQLVDLSRHYSVLRTTARSDAFHTWPQPLQSPVWHIALPRYKHLILYGPEQCGAAPLPYQHPAYLAGQYRLTINAGHMARFDRSARTAYCQQLYRDFTAGAVADDTIYLVNQSLVEPFRTNARRPVVCAEIDAVQTCVTAASYEPWKAAARFD